MAIEAVTKSWKKKDKKPSISVRGFALAVGLHNPKYPGHSSTLLAQWLLKQSPVKANNRRKKLSIPVRRFALAVGLHNPKYPGHSSTLLAQWLLKH